MSTHCVLGVKHTDGNIIGCYVHYDGYPSHMLDAIKDYVDNYSTAELSSLIERAQNTGGMRSFHSASFESETLETSMLDDNESYKIDKSNFYEDHMGTYAWYLVDVETGRAHMTQKTRDWDDDHWI